MRALLQRVSRAKVLVNGEVVGQITAGLVVLVGIKQGDTTLEADQLVGKITRLRIFPDQNGKMNHSVLDTRGELLIVSQFTLYADTRKGNRPSYSQAEHPEKAFTLYEYFVSACRNTGLSVATGVFQAHMDVQLVNDGPVTLFCSTEPDVP